MDFRAASLSAFFVLGGVSFAAAGPIVDAAQRAEALQAEGKIVEALDALDEAVDVVWTEGPLAFRKVALVESAQPDSRERTDRTYRADEKLVVRVEPVGYGFGTSPSGAKIGFSGDLALENSTGQILTEAKDMFQISKDTSARQRQFPMTLSVTVPYVRPGDYIARFTIRDQNSDKSGSFDVPFTVAAPTAPAQEQPGAAAGPATDGSSAAEGATAGSGNPALPPAGDGEPGQTAPQ